MMETDDKQKSVTSGPKTRVCYICGRQYGVNSYEIHLKQCKELFLAREETKPLRERKRLPKDPTDSFSKTDPTGTGSATPHSNGQNETNGHGSTAPGGMSLDEMNKLASEKFNTEVMEACKFCGRTFLAEKLPIHNKSCTADHPARRVGEVKSGVDPGGKTEQPQPGPPTAGVGVGTKKEKRPKKERKVSINYDGDVNEEEDEGGDKPLRVGIEDGYTDDFTNLKVSNGTLVGHMGGMAGRQLRNSPTKLEEQKRPQTTSSVRNGRSTDGNDNNDADFSTSSDDMLLKQVAAKLDFMEKTVDNLSKSIKDMKLAMAKFQRK